MKQVDRGLLILLLVVSGCLAGLSFPNLANPKAAFQFVGLSLTVLFDCLLPEPASTCDRRRRTSCKQPRGTKGGSEVDDKKALARNAPSSGRRL